MKDDAPTPVIQVCPVSNQNWLALNLCHQNHSAPPIQSAVGDTIYWHICDNLRTGALDCVNAGLEGGFCKSGGSELLGKLRFEPKPGGVAGADLKELFADVDLEPRTNFSSYIRAIIRARISDGGPSALTSRRMLAHSPLMKQSLRALGSSMWDLFARATNTAKYSPTDPCYWSLKSSSLGDSNKEGPNSSSIARLS
ncbi:hypothetical protein PIB30_028442 [Stylosanthes scabra]|uniref:Uncharacterized protein n=1 Tax=Stylosanthes scabra TaxID=79078 RepID=A0ABU6WAN0_9FABA|nr:hypothetical protein [Stylosanthes scabra]